MSQSPQIFFVYHPHYITFTALKWRRYRALTRQLDEWLLPEDGRLTPEHQAAVDEWCAEGVATVLFSALSLEAMGWHICVEWFGEEKASRSYERIGPAKRWISALSEKFNKTIPESDEAYVMLFELFKIRNSLVHRRSFEATVSTNIPNSLAYQPDWAEIAISALRSVPAAALSITGVCGFQHEVEMIERLLAE